jgi:hypothetical protein
MVAVVRAQIDRAPILARKLQADDLGRKLHRHPRVAGPEADVPDVVQRNHGSWDCGMPTRRGRIRNLNAGY